MTIRLLRKDSMRFSTRAFLCSFVPFAFLLTISFGLIQHQVLSTVREGLRESLRETHASVARIQSRSELQNNRFLRVIGENASLKAGLQLLRSEKNSREAQLTVVDQLKELCETLGFDLLLISDADGKGLGGVLRAGSNLNPIDPTKQWPPQHGFYTVSGSTFQVTSIPVNLGEENIGVLSIGESFDFSEFTTPTVLSRNGKVLKSSIPSASKSEIETALAKCGSERECEAHLGKSTFLSLPVETLSLGDGYALRSFQDVEAASGPLLAMLTKVFLVAGLGALLAAFLVTVLSSRSIVGPISNVVEHLRLSEKTHVLPEFPDTHSSIREIKEMTESFNRASISIREGREVLHRAYVDFVASLANALDARDPYTAGHSHRVSEMARTTANALKLSQVQVEEIRIGALLHDIGKIGVPDAVLQKPGKLTAEELTLIKQHPQIGRHILGSVHGFENYLPIVELHHENWDGTGYPHGLAAEKVPLAARIVHVVDAFDAMTTNRPYQAGMPRIKAMETLRNCCGTQFDAKVVETFLSTLDEAAPTEQISDLGQSLGNLAGALAAEIAPAAVLEKKV